MIGKVVRIVDTGTVPYAVVEWSNGYTGRVSITQIRADDGVIVSTEPIRKGW
jgi:hypothetical protein